MKMRESLPDHTANTELTKHFTQLSAKMLNLYERHGESSECIQAIQSETKNFCQSKFKNKGVLNNTIESYLLRNSLTSEHTVYRIVDNENLKVSFHLTTKGIKFPVHSHPEALNSILVVKGILKVKQYSFINSLLGAKGTMLNTNCCSAGLKKKYNTHALEAMAPFNAFFSIRCKAPNSTTPSSFSSSLKKTPKLLALGVSLFATINSYSFPQVNQNSLLVNMTSHDRYERTGSIRNLVIRANILRQKGEEDQYSAAQLYLVAANKKNPEAQYWLGYMHLLGMGITENSDEALHWISSSAKQEYPPAEELLDHILYGEPEYFC